MLPIKLRSMAIVVGCLMLAWPASSALIFNQGTSWKYLKGTAEASSPDTVAWRQIVFDDAGWMAGNAAFFYENGSGYSGNTELTDMSGSYSCIFMRKTFQIADPLSVGALQLDIRSDDGCVVWINGVEVASLGRPSDPITYQSVSGDGNGEPKTGLPLLTDLSYLVAGTNVIAVQAFNTSLGGSSDFLIDLSLTSQEPDFDPPVIANISPAPGQVSFLTQVTVTFNEPVAGVDAGDLRLNGVPAIGLTASGSDTFNFQFAQPAFGPVMVTWNPAHGITDFSVDLNPFDDTAPEATWQYELVDDVPPEVLVTVPADGQIVRSLDEIEVLFSEPVTGVDAVDLLINGQPAVGLLSDQPNQFIFTFPPPATGTVQVAWSPANGIADLAAIPNAFAGGDWSYTLDPNATPEILLITEFVATGNITVFDEDSETPDWMEIHNAGTVSVDLAGWYLTDDADDLAKWRFPSTPLEPGAFLIVFASGKDRAISGSELHTNFQLDGAGEYLALVGPDGITVVHDFNPEFPPQVSGLSYGVAFEVATTLFITEGSSLKWRVPALSTELPVDWADIGLSDAAWNEGMLGLGYEAAELDGGGVPAVGGTSSSNVALAKPTTQSSTAFGGTSDMAVDGNTGNYTHTVAGQGLSPIWEVDLGGFHVLDQVVIHNRDDCCGSRLRDITVQILSPDGSVTNFQSALINPENVLGTYPDGPATLSVDLVALTGGVVLGGRVQVIRTPDPDLSGSGGQGNADEADVLSMGEVEVFGVVAPPGYDNLITTDVETAMLGVNGSAFLRVPFTFDPAETPVIDLLTLRMKYDDGFVAYLNGVEIARRHAPATPLWNALASAENPDTQAIQFEDINITPLAGLLQEGDNVLAIQGLNLTALDDDFLVVAELLARSVQATQNRFFPTPTPGDFNVEAFLGLVDDTKFDPDRGFYEGPIAVTISNATPGVQIRYTLDGSEPSESNGLIYSGPIAVEGTTTLRASAFKAGWRPSNVDTHTYLFLDDVVQQTSSSTIAAGFPTTWGGTTPDYGMDPDVIGPGDDFGGKYAASIKEDLKSIPTLSIVMNIDDMFGDNGIYSRSTSRGLAWERAASAELINPDGTKGFQENCGIRIQGGAFRSHGLTKKHSMRLLFKGIYGATKLNYPLFGEDAPDSFDTVVFRSNSNDGWQWDAAGSQPLYMRDSFGRNTLLAMGGVSPHENFVHLYINGYYWGLYNPVERPDHSFSETNFGGDKEQWDAQNSGQANNGDLAAWNAMVSLANQGLASDANYQKIQGNNPDGTPNPAYPDYLDVENMIDYMIVNLYVGNTDWPFKNFWVGRDRTEASTGFKFYMWDSEWSMLLRSTLSQNRTTVGEGVAQAYAACRANEEFRVLFGDHLHRTMFNGGALYVDPQNPIWDPAFPERNQPARRIHDMSQKIERAIVAESARWGDQHRAVPYTRDEHWTVERDRLVRDYLPSRSAIVLEQFRDISLYPRESAPEFNQLSGVVPPDFELVMSHTNTTGTIYYTLDGTDPRLPGGGLSSSAIAYGDSMPIDGNVTVRARVMVGSNWSALMEGNYNTRDAFQKLAVTEIMYHPADQSLVDGDDFEFIELKNLGPGLLDLSGLSFSSGISFTFTNGTRLAQGEFIVLASNPAQVQARYPGLVVNGAYTGRLNNGGETLALSHVFQGEIRRFDYGTALPWPLTADGFDFSLVPRDDSDFSSLDDPRSWRASAMPGGSPGSDDPEPGLPVVLVNEVLTRSGPGSDIIELFNPGPADADIGGWYLSDSFRVPRKFRIPDGTTMLAGSYFFFDESMFNPTPGVDPSFSLSSLGEQILLYSGNGAGDLTGYSHGFEFGAAAEGITFGRYVISTGEEHFPPQIAPTLFRENLGPLVGPVVIEEIHYNPALGGDEFIEVRNLTETPLNLFEAGVPTNTWRVNGAGFDFPAGTVLDAGSLAVISSLDPALFRAKYSVPSFVMVYGPFNGSLQDNGERLELQRPETTTNGLNFITVDEVRYNDKLPWTTAPDGNGPSLQRIDGAAYGDDPVNWQAALVTPGSFLQPGLLPVVSSQPQDRSVVASLAVAFTVEALGGGTLQYQWRFEGDPIPGANGSSLFLTQVQPYQAGAYDVVVFNEHGAAISEPATLVVFIPANILLAPQSQAVRMGTDVSFFVNASSSSSITYQWQFNGVDIPGETGDSLVVPSVQEDDSGDYSVLISDAVGTISSPVAVLTVLLDPLVTVRPLSQAVAEGGSVTLSIETAGSLPMSYRWRKGSLTLTNLTLNSPRSFFTLDNVQTTDAGVYTVVLTNAAFSTPGILSPRANLSVVPDTDGDGMSDDYENANTLNFEDASDKDGDRDADGLTNFEESVAGTDPNDENSYLNVESLAVNGDVEITFMAQPLITYSIETSDNLSAPLWPKVAEVVATGTGGLRTLRIPATAVGAYFRLVTPWQP